MARVPANLITANKVSENPLEVWLIEKAIAVQKSKIFKTKRLQVGGEPASEPEPVEQFAVFLSTGLWDWEAAGSPETVDVFIVAGGGGGGASFNNTPRFGGGGGAGGRVFLENYAVMQDVSVIVGAGGLGSVDYLVAGTDGQASSFDGNNAIGGGGGASSGAVGANGGSGGGGGLQGTILRAPGLGTVGQGNNGANALASIRGGGGGGILTNGNAQNGGSGEEFNEVLYGTGGASQTGSGVRLGSSASPNTGDGGEGGRDGGNGGNGGSGIVIVRWFA